MRCQIARSLLLILLILAIRKKSSNLQIRKLVEMRICSKWLLDCCCSGFPQNEQVFDPIAENALRSSKMFRLVQSMKAVNALGRPETCLFKCECFIGGNCAEFVRSRTAFSSRMKGGNLRK